MDKNIKLLEGKILQVLLRLSGPLMGTAFVQMAYALTDIIWIGRIGTNAVAASGTVGMLIWFSNALMLIPRVGMSIRSSQAYGAGDLKATMKSFRNGFQLAILMGLGLCVLMIVFRNQIIGFFGLVPNVAEMAIQYLSIIALGFVFSFINPVLSASYNSMGNSVTPFRMNVIGLVLNIVLDPIMIFGFGFIPGMGIRGAAAATVFSQMIVTILFIVLIFKEKDLVYRSGLRKAIDREEMIGIIKLGAPSFFQSGIHSAVTMILNKYMAFYGAIPVAVYSVGSMIESISWMTTDGFSAALAAFTGQNYGAKNFGRIKEAFKLSTIIVTILGLFVTLCFFLFGDPLFRVFLPNDEAAIALGIKYLKIIGLSQVFMTIEIACTGVYNGIGEPKTPGIIGVVFNILRVPLALLLMPVFGVLGVWVSMSISAGLKGIVSIGILRGRVDRLLVARKA